MKQKTKKGPVPAAFQAVVAAKPEPARGRGRPSNGMGRVQCSLWMRPDAWEKFRMLGLSAGYRSPGEALERVVDGGDAARALAPVLVGTGGGR